MESIRAVLSPNGVAVIGASRNPGRIGHQIVQNLISYGFTGAVYPVNPNARSVCAVRAYPSIAAIPDPVDVAVVAVPKQDVATVADECGAAGIKGLIVISAGFREVGGDGVDRERQLLEVVRRHGMRMVGPNCMGVVNAAPERVDERDVRDGDAALRPRGVRVTIGRARPERARLRARVRHRHLAIRLCGKQARRQWQRSARCSGSTTTRSASS